MAITFKPNLHSMSSEEAQKFIDEVWGLQGVAYVVVVLRYYSRIVTLGWGKLALDDYLIALATLVYTAESTAAYYVVAYWKGLANNGMSDQDRIELDPSSEEWLIRVNGSKTHVIGLLLYMTLLWLLKGCWVVYYLRLTDGLPSQKFLTKWAMLVMPLTFVSCLLVAFLKCIPFDHQWQINPSPGNHCMPAISYIQTIFVMVMNTLTDFYLMAIPIPLVWNSRLPKAKKITLIVMFSGGLLEMAFGILRCVSILTAGDSDPAQSGYWSVRESFVSFVLTNMPMLYPLLKSFLEKIGTTMGFTSKNGESGRATGSGQAYRLGSYPDQHRKTKNRDPNPVPEETRYGSNEHIVPANDESHGADSRSEGISLDDRSHDPFHVAGGSEPARITVCSGPNPSNGRRPTPPDHSNAGGITVTREYNVSEGRLIRGVDQTGRTFLEV